MAGEVYLANNTDVVDLRNYVENKTTTLYINNPKYDLGWDLRATIPYTYQNYGNNCVAYNDVIYMFGSSSSSTYYQYLYKYNIKTNTWTTDTSKMSSAGVYGNNSSAIRIGNIAYVFGGDSAPTVAWKYNLDTDTITKLSTAIPFSFYGGAAVLDDDGKIHLLGGNGSNTAHYIYNPSNDTYTSSVSLPYNFYYSTACCVNNNIYIFGSSYSSSYYSYCYMLGSGTTSWAQRQPSNYYTYNGRAIVSADNKYIYIFGGSSYGQYLQKYDISTNTWSNTATYIPFNFYIGGLVKYNSAIYVIGGSGANTTMYRHRLRQKQFIQTGAKVATDSELCYIKNNQETALAKNAEGLYEITEDAYYYFDAEAQLAIIQ